MKITVRKIIEELIEEGYFNTWKTAKEIYHEIKIIKYSTLYPAVLNCVVQGILKSKEGEKVREFIKNG